MASNLETISMRRSRVYHLMMMARLLTQNLYGVEITRPDLPSNSPKKTEPSLQLVLVLVYLNKSSLRPFSHQPRRSSQVQLWRLDKQGAWSTSIRRWKEMNHPSKLQHRKDKHKAQSCNSILHHHTNQNLPTLLLCHGGREPQSHTLFERQCFVRLSVIAENRLNVHVLTINMQVRRMSLKHRLRRVVIRMLQ